MSHYIYCTGVEMLQFSQSLADKYYEYHRAVTRARVWSTCTVWSKANAYMHTQFSVSVAVVVPMRAVVYMCGLLWYECTHAW